MSNQNYEDILFIVLLALAILIPLFLMLREFVNWYFKTNKIVSQNEEIIRLLKIIANEPEPEQKPRGETFSSLVEKVNSQKRGY